MKSGTAKRSQMTIKTPLRELRQAVMCAIATDTYQGYQKDVSRETIQPTDSEQPRGAACDRFAHAHVTLGISLRHWRLHVLGHVLSSLSSLSSLSCVLPSCGTSLSIVKYKVASYFVTCTYCTVCKVTS